jgi:multiple sugar transport system substrate-binding protein
MEMTTFGRAAALLALAGTGMLLSGCPSNPPAGGNGGANGGSGGPMRLTFWHTRRNEQEQALKSLCEEYNRASSGVEIVPEYQGRYDDLHRKIRAVIAAKSLPALSVAYESHVSEYMANGVVRPLDDLVKDPEVGFKEDELADIHAQYLEANRFPQHQNQLLSFPFTKSNLVLYYNKTLMETQAAALSKLVGGPAYAFTADPSTLDGLIYSQGGQVLAPDGQQTLFDQPPTVRMLELLQRMHAGGTLLNVTRADDIPGLFVAQKIAFATDSSSNRANLEAQVGAQFQWDVAVIPHAKDVEPVTVMYGPNICLFKSTPEQEREAWKFVRYFVSPPVTARWARETGYLPIRKSAVELPEMKEFYGKNPRAWHVYEVLPLAKGEPNVVGWQEVRDQLRDSARAALAPGARPAEIAGRLKTKADQILAQSK